MDDIDDITRLQFEIEKNVTPRGGYLSREDRFWEPVEGTYLSLQRRLFFMDAGSFSVERRFVLDEKLRRLQKQIDQGLILVYDVRGLNSALDSIQVTQEDNPLYFPDIPLQEGSDEIPF